MTSNIYQQMERTGWIELNFTLEVFLSHWMPLCFCRNVSLRLYHLSHPNLFQNLLLLRHKMHSPNNLSSWGSLCVLTETEFEGIFLEFLHNSFGKELLKEYIHLKMLPLKQQLSKMFSLSTVQPGIPCHQVFLSALTQLKHRKWTNSWLKLLPKYDLINCNSS